MALAQIMLQLHVSIRAERRRFLFQNRSLSEEEDAVLGININISRPS